jgi:polysaccharide deacetylase 2 family uncharacterized protein YibQ
MSSKPTAQERKPDPYPRRLYLILAGLALLSAIALDYRTARRGEKAYFFRSWTVWKEAAVAPVPLADALRRFLETSGVPSPWVEGIDPTDGNPRILVRLPREDYADLRRLLERELRNKRAAVKKEKGREEGLTSYSWRITGEKQERLTLVFALTEPPKEETAKTEAPPQAPGGRAAIIIDDMGASLEALKEVCDLGQPITISVLPQSLYAEETARIAHGNGLEVMLHLPGESLNHEEGNSSTPGLIRSGMGKEDVVSLVEEGLSRVPYAEGVNNHMGSRITQEEPVMRPILDLIKSRGLYFLDSRTTAESIAFDLATKIGLRAAYRNIFLDSTVGTEFSKRKLLDLCLLAQRQGTAIAIGHPFPETLQALRESLGILKAYRVTPVFVSEIIPK